MPPYPRSTKYQTDGPHRSPVTLHRVFFLFEILLRSSRLVFSLPWNLETESKRISRSSPRRSSSICRTTRASRCRNSSTCSASTLSRGRDYSRCGAIFGSVFVKCLSMYFYYFSKWCTKGTKHMHKAAVTVCARGPEPCKCCLDQPCFHHLSTARTYLTTRCGCFFWCALSWAGQERGDSPCGGGPHQNHQSPPAVRPPGDGQRGGGHEAQEALQSLHVSGETGGGKSCPIYAARLPSRSPC